MVKSKVYVLALLSLINAACIKISDGRSESKDPVVHTGTALPASIECTIIGYVDEGTETITEEGVCYNTTGNPTLNSNKVSNPSHSEPVFSFIISGLSATTKYYVRAFASTSKGTVYGEEINFTTDQPTVTDKDGNVYKTVLINGKLWMAESLRTWTFRNGDFITHDLNDSLWQHTKDAHAAMINNSINYSKVWGDLYNWWAVSDPRGLAPQGWHIPSKQEVDSLIAFLGGITNGGKLKSTIGYTNPNVGASNAFNFNAMPAGCKLVNGSFYGLNTDFTMWTSTDDGTGLKYAMGLLNSSANVTLSAKDPNNGFSIRCVKD